MSEESHRRVEIADISGGHQSCVLGPPGVGKTHLAVTLGRESIKIGYSVLFTPVTTLLYAPNASPAVAA